MKSFSTNPRVLLCTVYRRSFSDYFDIAGEAIYRFPKVKTPRRISPGLRFIKQNVPDVEILEYPLWHEYVEKLKEGWDVVGFSFYNVQIDDIERMADEARHHGIREIWAGNYGALDEKVPGIADRIFIGPAEDQIAQVFGYRVQEDEIEHPVMLVHTSFVPGNIRLLTFGLLYTQRGCPFKCTFCQTPAFDKRHFPINSESVKRVLNYYKKMGINYVCPMDETFGVHTGFTDQLTELFNRLGFRWWAQTRVEIAHRNLDKWYERGMRMLAIGVESMNQSSLNSVNKRQRIEEIIDFARHSGEKPDMYRVIYYITGFENMTAEETIQDARNLEKLGFDVATVGIITPYPKTLLWDELHSKYGIFDRNYRHYDNEHLVWNHPHISPTEMRQLRVKVLSILNKPLDIYRKSFFQLIPRSLHLEDLKFAWRHIVKAPVVSILTNDRRQVFLPKLGTVRDGEPLTYSND